MPSTYSSNLKIELMSTGENSGTWGNITNTNLGTALEQAIVGYGAVSYLSDANLTISITNTNAAQAARALVLNVTSALSLTATRELVVPTIEKQYIVQNNTTGSQSITVKTSAGTGITVPNGRKAHLYVDGTNVIQMFDFVDINGGTIDGTPIGGSSAAAGAFTTLNASGATTLDGNVTLGNAAGDNITFTGTITSHLLFTDNTYDIGANGATRPRNLFLAGNATVGGNLSVGGTLTLTGGVNLNGNVTVGDNASDTLTINSTITSNLIFTDNTYDIGASGATRPRNLFLAGSGTIGGNVTTAGRVIVDDTTDSSSTITGSIQTDGGLGVAKAVYIGTTLNIGGLTSGRVAYVTTSGRLTDSANMTFDGTSLTLANDAYISGLTVGRGGGASATNTVAGASALAGNSTGVQNVAIGYQAMNVSTTSSYSVAIGYQAGASLTSGIVTAVGQSALKSTTIGTNLTAVGQAALTSNSTGSNNTAVGYAALIYNTTGGSNTAVGNGALVSNTTANSNNAFGAGALYTNTTGTQLVAVGTEALYANTTANNNVAVGYRALYANTTGTSNVAMGYGALRATTTGGLNTAIGHDSMSQAVGIENTALGYHSLLNQTSPDGNTAIGAYAARSVTTGSGIVAVGRNALYSMTTAGNSTAVGSGALQSTTVSDNTAVGAASLNLVSTGADNTAVGSYTGPSITTGANNTLMGYRSMFTATTASYNVAIGMDTLYSMTTANGNTAVGYQAARFITTGSSNVAVGSSALYSNNTGAYNVAIGDGALQSNTTANNNTVIGYQAALANTTGGALNVLGEKALLSNTTGTYIVAIGNSALRNNTTGNYSTAVGVSALENSTTGSNNVVLGYQAGYTLTTASNNIGLGTQALYGNTITGGSNIAIGLSDGTFDPPMRYLTSGSFNIGIGNGALASFGSTALTGQYNIALGHGALYRLTTASNSVAVGHNAGASVIGNGANTFIGTSAGNATTGQSNTFIGCSAGESVTTGQYNTILGRWNGNQNGLDIRTLNNYIVLSDGSGNPRLWYPGTTALTTLGSINMGEFTGTNNVAVILNNSPDSHSASTVPSYQRFGGTANYEVVYERNGANTFNNSYCRISAHIGGVFAGVRAVFAPGGEFYPYADNAYSCGINGNRWSAIWAANGTIQTSDARQKTEVADSSLGLNFINALRPVSYKWIVGRNEITSDFDAGKDESGQYPQVATPVPGKRTHFGLLAQEVKAALGDQDFGGFIYDAETDTYALRYDQFVSPLIKAVQELTQQLAEVKAELATLKGA